MKIFLNIRAFNYETRPVVTCKHLPWVGDGTNAEVKRNVNCDLYEKKGKTHIGDITEISASHRYCNHWLLFFYAVYVRKCIVGKGEDYRGKVSTTRSGLTCQQWWSKFPHDHRWVTSSDDSSVPIVLEKKHCEDKVLHFTFSSKVNNSTALFIIIFQLWERSAEVGNSRQQLNSWRNFPE